MNNKTLAITLPEWMWGRLATMSVHRGTDAADLVAVAVVGLLRDDPHRLAELEMELKAARNGGYQTPKVRASKNRSNT